jgi:SAM-dependent methyltransferase
MTKLEIQAAGGDTGTPLNLQKRLDWISAVAGPLRGKRAIDCGCGAGEYVRALTNLGADAWGIEYSSEKIDQALRLGGLPEERVAVGDIEAIEFADDHFDVALINEVLEHVPHDGAGRFPTTYLLFRTSPCAWAYSNTGRETTGPGNCARWSAQADFQSSVAPTSGRPSKTFPAINRS